MEVGALIAASALLWLAGHGGAVTRAEGALLVAACLPVFFSSDAPGATPARDERPAAFVGAGLAVDDPAHALLGHEGAMHDRRDRPAVFDEREGVFAFGLSVFRVEQTVAVGIVVRALQPGWVERDEPQRL